MVAVAAPRYEIVCRLGAGGMADLFLARAGGVGGFERLVVVKRLNSQLASNPAMVQALFDEARIAASLSHANIVAVNDVEVVEGQVSIVMEYLHGHDVSHLVRRLGNQKERIPLDQAIAIALGVCAGLHHAHDRVGSDGVSLDIVHRDVSPHNVFVTYDGVVKIIDFGIARATSRRGHTEHGVIKGKPGYIAPEQVRGKIIDRRTDIWAMAVLLYEMTTGTAPFGHGGVAFDQLVAVVTEDPPLPSKHVDNYPPELEAIVLRGMAREPDARYPTAEAMRADLEAFARSRGLNLSPFGLSALMERVFGKQISAWRQAQREGRSLSEHVAALRMSGMHHVIEEVPANDPAPTPDPKATERLAELESRLTAERAASAPVAGQVAAEPPRAPPRLGRRWRIAIGMVATPFVVIAGMALWSVLAGSHHLPPDPAQSLVDPPTDRAVAIDPAPTPTAPAPAALDPTPVSDNAAEPVAQEPEKPTTARSAKRAAPAPDVDPSVAHAEATAPPAPSASDPGAAGSGDPAHAQAQAQADDDDLTIDPPRHDSPFVAPPARKRAPAAPPAKVRRPRTSAATPTPSSHAAASTSHAAAASTSHAAAPSGAPDPDAPLPR